MVSHAHSKHRDVVTSEVTMNTPDSEKRKADLWLQLSPAINASPSTTNVQSPWDLNSGEMPSTAEIIQKCLNVNPFDLKFREANMQINGQNEQTPDSGGQINLPTTPSGLSMLKLPSTLAQSPSIFSNLNVLNAADLESGLRKTMDFQRKVQQLRDNANLVKQEGNRTPCTADVLNAVLDMNMNHLGNGPITIPSTSSLVAGLAAAAQSVSTVATSADSMNLVNTMTSSGTDPIVKELKALDSTPSTTKSDDCSASTSQVTSQANSFPPTSESEASNTDRGSNLLHASSISNMISNSSTLTLNPVNNSMPNLHSNFNSNPPTTTGPPSNGLLSARASPALNVSPRSTVLDLNKPLLNNGLDSLSCVNTDAWDTLNDIKPLINKPYSSYETLHGRLELNTSAAGSDIGSQPNSLDGPNKPRKYARYHNPGSNESHTTQSSGRGRGRRSLTSEMPPDERRMTILERNKAAAVRYRKRKKEEHDEMMTRAQTLEQDKIYLQTQNSVLRREVERLTEMLKIRDARCICRNASGLPLFNGADLNNDHLDSESKNLAAMTSSGLDHTQFLLQNN
ncbi:unnamed protein product [Bursaphelenchus xylophilus]|uniref:(pine wood nematode) hypothetical protein n=1 Tax=Bursaphelenchus xylophilus TaxID=6326 RepID=A0A1I7ST17_BURXY|nr:unnamed protein product [Bursaphelenchus xylophilus]CAG9108791.1 unnamed protein product [Bursaphelenchus xylophilus]